MLFGWDKTWISLEKVKVLKELFSVFGLTADPNKVDRGLVLRGTILYQVRIIEKKVEQNWIARATSYHCCWFTTKKFSILAILINLWVKRWKKCLEPLSSCITKKVGPTQKVTVQQFISCRRKFLTSIVEQYVNFLLFQMYIAWFKSHLTLASFWRTSISSLFISWQDL